MDPMIPNFKLSKESIIHNLFEAAVIASIVGIWPRWVETNLLKVTKLFIEAPLADPLKIVMLSDLHLNSRNSDLFLNKLLKKVKNESPDIILWGGDFLCSGKVSDKKRFLKVLASLKAPLGVFAVLGNHDYEKGIIVNENGDYDISENSQETPFLKGIKRLFSSNYVSGKVTERAKALNPSKELLDILKQENIKLLDNETIEVARVNITGISERMGGKDDVEKAFSTYNKDLPGIILVHNPDVIPSLLDRPGSLILAGHTHGGQINLPYLWRQFTLMENPEYKSGFYKRDSKEIYVSKGLGGVFPFRLNAIPEIVSITFGKKK